jgi:site-specific recombinase XerD
MACLRKRRNKWVVDYRVGAKRFVSSFCTKGEGEVYLRELKLRQIDNLIGYLPVNAKELSVAAGEYLKAITTQKSTRTAEVDSIALNELVNAFPNALVQEISTQELELYKVRLLQRFAAATVNRKFNVIRHFFRKCLEWRYLALNPTIGIQRLREDSACKQTFKVAEIDALIIALPLWAVDIVSLIANTGIRRNEAIELDWRDVNLDTRQFTVRSEKGGVSRCRIIPMTEKTFQIFLKRLNEGTRVKALSKLVFLDFKKEKINPRTLSSVVIKTGKRIGQTNAGLHILRHTLLTELAENRVNMATIQTIAGHSNLTTTRRYIHPESENIRASLEVLETKRMQG